MMTIRDILKSFFLDRCEILEKIEKYKEQKKDENTLPFTPKIICIINTFFITAFLMVVIVSGIVGYSYPTKWISGAGIAFLMLAYFLNNSKSIITQYITMILSIFGFSIFVLGADGGLENGSLLYVGLISFAFLIATYNVFNSEIYHYFGTIVVCFILAAFAFEHNMNAVEYGLGAMFLFAVVISLFPLKYMNLYSMAKAIIIFIAAVLLFQTINNGFDNEGQILKYVISLIVFILAGLSLLYKSKDQLLKFIVFPLMLFVITLLGSYGVGFSCAILLLGYVLNSFVMFVFGAFFCVLYIILMTAFSAINPEYISGAFLLLGIVLAGVALTFKEKTYEK